MSSTYYIPSVLLAIPRNPVTAVGLPLVLGVLSGAGTANAVRGQWYKNLFFPPGRPPRQVFPIVWPALYISMGYASYLAVDALDLTLAPSTRADISLGLGLYFAQLGLNFLWSPLFFNAKHVGVALIDSVLMAGTTFYMTSLLHGPTSGKTTYFLLPYCMWLTFATYLNGGIWWLNRNRNVPKID